MKTNKNTKQLNEIGGHARQGDVLIVCSAKSNGKRTKTKKCTLALGESTGHHHTIESGAIGFASDEVSLAEYIEVEEKLADLEHQEHATIPVPKGNYEVARQVEYTPKALRNVID
jgi:hypothetical protein